MILENCPFLSDTSFFLVVNGWKSPFLHSSYMYSPVRLATYIFREMNIWRKKKSIEALFSRGDSSWARFHKWDNLFFLLRLFTYIAYTGLSCRSFKSRASKYLPSDALHGNQGGPFECNTLYKLFFSFLQFLTLTVLYFYYRRSVFVSL